MAGHCLRGRALSWSLMRKMRFRAIVQKGVRAPAPSFACIRDVHLSQFACLGCGYNRCMQKVTLWVA